MICQKSSYKITVTIGISTYNGQQKIHELIKQADTHLYEGKQNGKNCVVA
jgi:diguanylate cyclase (GGDEF)-like protein